VSTNETLPLNGKTAVVFGAGGDVGSEVARQLAAQGARVFLSGRTKTRVQETADTIAELRGEAAVAQVDASDEDAVKKYLDQVVATAGSIDIVFNAMGPPVIEYRNAVSAMELPVDNFMLPMTTIVRSQFITARAAAKHFAKVTSGVILFLSATPSRGVSPGTSAIGTAYGALESL
jgi:NAD(P)-dependent dehydrogenase (short-subunit alcohol dehydrogenase family)